MRELDLGENNFGENGPTCLATCVHKLLDLTLERPVQRQALNDQQRSF